MHRVPERESQTRRVQRARPGSQSVLTTTTRMWCRHRNPPLRASAWVSAAEAPSEPSPRCPNAGSLADAMPSTVARAGECVCGVDRSCPPFPPPGQGHETGAQIARATQVPPVHVLHRPSPPLSLLGSRSLWDGSWPRHARTGTAPIDVLRGAGPQGPRLGRYGASPPSQGGRYTERGRPRMKSEKNRGRLFSWLADKFLGDLTAAATRRAGPASQRACQRASKPVSPDARGGQKEHKLLLLLPGEAQPSRGSLGRRSRYVCLGQPC